MAEYWVNSWEMIQKWKMYCGNFMGSTAIDCDQEKYVNIWYLDVFEIGHLPSGNLL